MRHRAGGNPAFKPPDNTEEKQKGAISNPGNPATQAAGPGRLELVALKPLSPLLGAVSIPFFKPADLPLLENQFRINPFLQTVPQLGSKHHLS